MSANSRREACMRIIGRMQNDERGELIAEVLNTYGLPDEVKEGITKNIGTSEWAQLSSWVEYVVAMEDDMPAGQLDACSADEARNVCEEDDASHDFTSAEYEGQTCIYCGHRSCCAAHTKICYECWATGKPLPG